MAKLKHKINRKKINRKAVRQAKQAQAERRAKTQAAAHTEENIQKDSQNKENIGQDADEEALRILAEAAYLEDLERQIDAFTGGVRPAAEPVHMLTDEEALAELARIAPAAEAEAAASRKRLAAAYGQEADAPEKTDPKRIRNRFLDICPANFVQSEPGANLEDFPLNKTLAEGQKLIDLGLFTPECLIRFDAFASTKEMQEYLPPSAEYLVLNAAQVYIAQHFGELQYTLAGGPNLSYHGHKLLEKIQQAITGYNAVFGKSRWKFTQEKSLPPYAVAALLEAVFHFRRVRPSDDMPASDTDLLAYYESEGPFAGTYRTNLDRIFSAVYDISPSMSKTGMSEVISRISCRAPSSTVCREKNLIPVGNGIFDADKKELLPFTCMKTFMSKSLIAYKKGAEMPSFTLSDGSDWDFDAWLDELFESDSELIELIWQVFESVLRPNVRYDQAVMLYSESGNSGKGTLCELLKQLCGPGAYASLSIADFSQDFRLEPLIHANAVITDENSVGQYIDASAAFKAVVTGDTVSVNRKYKAPISWRFSGIVIQCINELPKMRDRSDSMARRQLIVPFPHCFTGREFPEIKQRFMHDPALLEAVLARVLENTSGCTRFIQPEACRQALFASRLNNDPVRAFWYEHKDRFKWNFLPGRFLYAIYAGWMKSYVPGGTPVAERRFRQEIAAVIDECGGWDAADRVYTAKYLTCAEPMASEYNASDWILSDAGKPLSAANLPMRAAGYLRNAGTPGKGPKKKTKDKGFFSRDEVDQLNSWWKTGRRGAQDSEHAEEAAFSEELLTILDAEGARAVLVRLKEEAEARRKARLHRDFPDITPELEAELSMIIPKAERDAYNEKMRIPDDEEIDEMFRELDSADGIEEDEEENMEAASDAPGEADGAGADDASGRDDPDDVLSGPSGGKGSRAAVSLSENGGFSPDTPL